MPSVNSSISSRARFSFGALTVFCWPSSQMISAGSRSIAFTRTAKSPRPYWRMVCSWPSIRAADLTFCTLVAQCPCQKKSSFSVNWCGAVTIRSTHHCDQRLDLVPGRLLGLLPGVAGGARPAAPRTGRGRAAAA